MEAEPLPVVQAADLAKDVPAQRWLIRDVWTWRARGVLGGEPKLGKTWLGLDISISVASGTPCLGHYEVEEPGRALIYLAEDDEPDVRCRIEAICVHRGLDVNNLDLHVITVPVLRLDRRTDQQRLVATLEHFRPRLLLLDPLVRIHRLDENDARDISGLLGFLTELGRHFETAIALTHHTSKKSRKRPGQALRGSSDLYAWGKSYAFLSAQRDCLLLTLEHRSAPAPKPVRVALVSRPDGTATHFEVLPGQGPRADNQEPSLSERVLELLRSASKPLLRRELRERLRINNKQLGDVLVKLERARQIRREPKGWCLPTRSPSPSIAGQNLLFDAMRSKP